MQIAKERIEIALQGAIICGDLSLRWQSSPLIIQLYSRGRQQVDERSRTVADLLNEAGFSTLTMDLLARDEGTQSAVPMQLRFNIDALSERVCGILRWLENAGYKPIGIFGTGTSSAAALIASAQLRCCVSAVVLFGGRPDLAGETLLEDLPPTLLIVGEFDGLVVDLNQSAIERMTCTKQLISIPAATHLCDGRASLQRVIELSAAWYRRYVPSCVPELEMAGRGECTPTII